MFLGEPISWDDNIHELKYISMFKALACITTGNVLLVKASHKEGLQRRVIQSHSLPFVEELHGFVAQGSRHKEG
jgi:hypothetical protein